MPIGQYIFNVFEQVNNINVLGAHFLQRGLISCWTVSVFLIQKAFIKTGDQLAWIAFVGIFVYILNDWLFIAATFKSSLTFSLKPNRIWQIPFTLG